MPVLITVEDENGEAEHEYNFSNESIAGLIELMPSDSFLKDIDFYGDTTFNKIQCKRIQSELQAVFTMKIEGEEVGRLLKTLVIFIEYITLDVHLYLKFYGD